MFKIKVIHPLEPIYNENSKILILGSMPSVISRQLKFYYANPQNRFWLVMEKLFNTKITERKKFLLEHNIALWDVIASCEITKSSDSSIKNVNANDINKLLKKTAITQIFVTGNKAYELYNKYIEPKTKIKAVLLPSTSSANATYSLAMLVEKYQIIKEYLK